MSEGVFSITVSTAGLGPEQRQQIDAQLRSEGIPATWAGETIQVDQAFESRVEGMVATARSEASAPAPGFVDTSSPPPTYAQPGYAPAPVPTYPQPGFPQAGYPAGYGYPMGQPTVTNSNATTSLVLALIGWFVCPIASIFGVIYGRRAQDEIAASGGTQSGDGLAKAGIIISWLIIGLYGLVIVGMIVFFILFGIIGIAASTT